MDADTAVNRSNLEAFVRPLPARDAVYTGFCKRRWSTGNKHVLRGVGGGRWLLVERDARLEVFEVGGKVGAHGQMHHVRGTLWLDGHAITFVSGKGSEGAAGHTGARARAPAPSSRSVGGVNIAHAHPYGPPSGKHAGGEFVLPLGLVSGVRLEQQLFGPTLVTGTCEPSGTAPGAGAAQGARAHFSHHRRILFRLSFKGGTDAGHGAARDANSRARNAYEAILDAIGQRHARERAQTAHVRSPHAAHPPPNSPPLSPPGAGSGAAREDDARAGAAIDAPAALPTALVFADNPFVVHVPAGPRRC